MESITEPIMTNIIENIIKAKTTWREDSANFRERMGHAEYSEYMKPYMLKYNAKEQTKAMRKIKNAEYYQKRKVAAALIS